VITGDARNPEVLRRALGGRGPSLLLTDPPYCLLTRRRKGGDERERRAGRKIDRDPVHRFEDVRAYRRFTVEWLPAAARSVVERLARVYEVALVLRREPLPQLGAGDAARPWSVVASYDEEGEAARWGSHPNHKPFGVLDPLIRTWSRPGDLVLDCFAGSGSIPAAAVRLGRDVSCIELEAEWAERVRMRLREDPAPSRG